MKSTKILAILMFGLMVWPASVAEAHQRLNVNGNPVASITLELGQSCTVEVVSDDGMSYTDYVGFDNGVVLGDFSHLETKPEAGNVAAVAEYNEPAFYGYRVTASGEKPYPPPRPGVHFIFEYEAQQVGETDVVLAELIKDKFVRIYSVQITVIPAPMGTAITYQGSLNDAGSPADGLYDFEFKLYHAPNGGIQEGDTIGINDLDVIEGQFTIELDFGSDPNIFNGYARWLQIGVRPAAFNDPCEYTVLSPRTELTPTPYALYAQETAYAQGATDLALPYSGTASSGAGAFSITNTGTGYAGNFEQTGASNSNGGLNVTTTAGQYGAKILNQGGNSGYVELYGLRAEATSTNKSVHGGYFKAHSGGGRSRGIYIDADNTNASSGAKTYGIQLSCDCAKGRGWGVSSCVTAGRESQSHLYGIYSYGEHSGVTGQSYGMWSEVYGSNTGDSYGIYSEGNKVNSDTAGNAYGGYFSGDNGRSGGESYGVYGTARGYGNQRKSYGVYGEATDTGPYTNYGGYFKAAGIYGRGIYAKGGQSGYAAEFHGNVIIKNRDGDTTLMQLGEGLDYAEGFDVSESTKIDAGSVLIIDADNPGKLAISDKPYDSKVAGIVAGAKGQGSGVRLGSEQFDCDVALAGRVYCNVDATEAAVQPGDLLTTSATPGYAMKATDYMRTQGAILGKAMESLEKGQKGQILVLVTLQ